ncbi:hypothetical protein [Lysobacter olei]
MSMDYLTPAELSISDPLSDVTRKERRMLLGLDVLAIFVSTTGLVPTKISALGVEFGAADQRAFLYVFAAVLAYFVAAFLVYGVSDYLGWRIRHSRAWNTHVDKAASYIYQEPLHGPRPLAHHIPLDLPPLLGPRATS